LQRRPDQHGAGDGPKKRQGLAVNDRNNNAQQSIQRYAAKYPGGQLSFGEPAGGADG